MKAAATRGRSQRKIVVKFVGLAVQKMTSRVRSDATIGTEVVVHPSEPVAVSLELRAMPRSELAESCPGSTRES